MLGSHVGQIGGLPLRDPSWMSFTALCMHLAGGPNRPQPVIQPVDMPARKPTFEHKRYWRVTLSGGGTNMPDVCGGRHA